MKNIIHVVAYQYNTGGGFDWFPKQEDADQAYLRAQTGVCIRFANENYLAFRFDMKTNTDIQDKDDITREVEAVFFTITIPSVDWWSDDGGRTYRTKA